MIVLSFHEFQCYRSVNLRMTEISIFHFPRQEALWIVLEFTNTHTKRTFFVCSPFPICLFIFYFIYFFHFNHNFLSISINLWEIQTIKSLNIKKRTPIMNFSFSPTFFLHQTLFLLLSSFSFYSAFPEFSQTQNIIQNIKNICWKNLNC